MQDEKLINQNFLIELVSTEVKELFKKQANELEPRTIKMKTFCKDFCHNKSAEWVRTFIFDAYPETNEENGGFVLNPHWTKQGKVTSILVKPARAWLDKHEYEIDWNARLPKGDGKQ